ITKIVNSMTTHMQIGSPMASAYLLGLPDHYTSHKFKCAYWKPYLMYALRGYEDSIEVPITSLSKSDTVGIKKIKNEYQPIDPVQDYIMRPDNLSNVSLYKWLQCYDKEKVLNAEQLYNICDDDIEEHEDNDIKPVISTNNLKRKRDKSVTNECLIFQNHHPQFTTHVIKLVESNKNRVLNFLGGSFPSRDGPNPNYYAATMLTIFKPWRNGNDLKNVEEEWIDSFKKFTFSKQELELMKFFNIKHECIDEADDY
ncbi:hypothetical protein M422DRAFT_77669, partial [Sphaerobolus stellatus SS14]